MTDRIYSLDVTERELHVLKAGIGALSLISKSQGNLEKIAELTNIAELLTTTEGFTEAELAAQDLDLVELNERERMLVDTALGALFTGLANGTIIDDIGVAPMELIRIGARLNGLDVD